MGEGSGDADTRARQTRSQFGLRWRHDQAKVHNHFSPPPRSLSALLPVAWVKSGRIEKKVVSEHKKLAGTSDIDAKVLYVKLARGLPTFGVHFFLVKVRIVDPKSEFIQRVGAFWF